MPKCWLIQAKYCIGRIIGEYLGGIGVQKFSHSSGIARGQHVFEVSGGIHQKLDFKVHELSVPEKLPNNLQAFLKQDAEQSIGYWYRLKKHFLREQILVSKLRENAMKWTPSSLIIENSSINQYMEVRLTSILFSDHCTT